METQDMDTRSIPAIHMREALRKHKTTLTTHLKDSAAEEVIRGLSDNGKITPQQYEQLLMKGPESRSSQINTLLSFALQDRTSETALALVEELQKAKSSNCTKVVKEIIERAQHQVTQVLEIDDHVDKRIEECLKPFIENLKGTREIIIKLYSSGLINEEENRQLENEGVTETLCVRIYQVLRRLDSNDKKLKFIQILNDTHNDVLAKSILSDEDYSFIKKKKISAIQDMVQTLKTEYKKKYQQVVGAAGSRAKEFLIDFGRDDNELMKLAFTAFCPNNPSKAKKWAGGEHIYPLHSLDSLQNEHDFQCVLFQGDPGCGKTTLLLKWLHDWTNTAHVFDETELPQAVLYIPMKQVRQQSVRDIVFDDLNLLPAKYKPVFDILMNEYLSGVVFLVDGLDENKSMSNENELHRIITNDHVSNGNRLHMKVYATCRMYETFVTKFKPYAEIAITLSGVEESSAHKFIASKLDLSQQAVDDFVLDCKKVLGESILTIPIYITLLCMLAKEQDELNITHIFGETVGKTASPETKTSKTQVDIFDAFIDNFKHGFCSHLAQENTTYTAERCTKVTEDLFHKFGRLSFDSLLVNKNVFSKEIFQNYDIDVSDVERLGLFIHSPGTSDYRFWHQTFEEYFAGAYYCARIGFEQAILTLLSQKGLLYEMPVVMTTALQHAAETPKPTESQNCHMVRTKSETEMPTDQENPTTSTENSIRQQSDTIDVASKRKFSRQKSDTGFTHQTSTSNTTNATPPQTQRNEVEVHYQSQAENKKAHEINHTFNAERRDISPSANEPIQNKMSIENQEEYDTKKHECYLYEKEFTVSLQQTLRPLDGCFQFACGKNSTFASKLFIFAKYACCINSWTGKDGVKKLYDLRYECSLLFEAQKPNIFAPFVDFLTKADPYVHTKHGLSVSANAYNRSTAKYIQDSMPSKLKAKLFRHLYNISCGLFEHDEYSDLAMITNFQSTNVSDQDLFLSSLPSNILPKELHIIGKEENLAALASSMKKKEAHLDALYITKMFREPALVLFEAILPMLPMHGTLKSLHLVHCELQSRHFELITEALNTFTTVPVIRISGCNAKNIPSSFYKAIQIIHQPSTCTIDICENQMKLILNHMEVDNDLFIMEDIFCNTVGPLVSHFSNIRKLHITNSILFDSTTRGKWTRFCSALKSCAKLTHLTIEGCNIIETFHLKEIRNLMSDTKDIRSLCLSGNKLNQIEEVTWKSLVRELQARSGLETLKFAFCGLSKSCLKDLTCQLAPMKSLNEIEIEGNDDPGSCYLIEDESADTIEKIIIPCCKFRRLKDTEESASTHCQDTKDQHSKTLNVSQTLSDTDSDIQTTVTLLQTHSIPDLLRKRDFNLSATLTTLDRTMCLTTLVLSGTNFSAYSRDEFERLTNSIAQFHSLEKLDLSRCGLVKSRYFNRLADCLEAKNLIDLDLSHNALPFVEEEFWKKFMNAIGSGGGLQALHLLKCNLQKRQLRVIGKALAKCNDMQVLELSHNNLSRVPEDVWESFCINLKNCSNMRYFGLSKTGFENDFQIRHLMTAVGHMPDIEHLGISFSAFHTTYSVPPEALEVFKSCYQLKELRLSDCGLQNEDQVKKLRLALQRMTTLTSLDLSENNFKNMPESSWANLCIGIGRCTALEKINFATCSLEHSYHFEYLGGAIVRSNKLKQLDISGNDVSKTSPHTWETFCATLQTCIYLQRVELDACNLTQATHIKILSYTLGKLKQLNFLNLSRNNNATEHVPASASTLSSKTAAYLDFSTAIQHCDMLQTLLLANCNLKLFFQDFTEALTKLHFIRSIDISHNVLSNVAEVSWEYFFHRDAKCLQELNLASCKLHPKHLTMVAKGLHNCCNLETLNLSGNDFSDITNQQEFNDSLKGLTQLVSLKMAECNLKGNIFQGVLCAVEHLNHIKILDISQNVMNLSNDAGNDGFRETFVTMVKSKENWENISMSSCVQNEHATDFLDVLRPLIVTHFNTLKRLNLCSNGLSSCSDLIWQMFTAELARCFSLTELDISHNGLTDSQFKVFLEKKEKPAHFPSLEILNCHSNNFQSISDSEDYRKFLRSFPALISVDGGKDTFM